MVNMENIKAIKAFKIGRRVFESIEEAEKYKFEELDDIVLGDYVIVKELCGGKSNLRGTVFFIEDDQYYFAIGDTIPKELLGVPMKIKVLNLKIKQQTYSFDIGIQPRRNLYRIGNIYSE